MPCVKRLALRHMLVTLLPEAGVPAHVVAEQLGHKDVTMTFKVYAHVTQRLSDQRAGRCLNGLRSSATTHRAWLPPC